MAMKSVLSELHVKADGGNPNRTTILVVSGVGDMLKIEAREESREQSRAVIALPDVFRPVLQAAISDQKVIAAACQVERMNSGNSADG